MYRHFYGPGPVGPIAPEGGHLVFGIFAILFWVLAIWLIVSFVRHGHHYFGLHHHNHDHADPIDIAKARYAKGEIDKAQYEQIKKDLS